MSVPGTSQDFESYVPVYDVIPDKWEDAQAFLVEALKKIANAINVREIGWLLDQELLSGQAFIPATSSNPPQYRSVFRKVIDFSPVVGGVPKAVAHGINFDSRFTLLHLYAGATNSGTLLAEPIPNGADTITMDVMFITITAAASYDRVFCTVEYILEV